MKAIPMSHLELYKRGEHKTKKGKNQKTFAFLISFKKISPPPKVCTGVARLEFISSFSPFQKKKQKKTSKSGPSSAEQEAEKQSKKGN
jgi:hypothetical protein